MVMNDTMVEITDTEVNRSSFFPSWVFVHSRISEGRVGSGMGYTLLNALAAPRQAAWRSHSLT